MLVFSIDQGFPNGPVQNDDASGLRRAIDDLKRFATNYDTYALLAADQRNKTYLDAAFDLLSQNDVPFILEALSSDATTLEAGTAPYDRSHGQELSISELQEYKARYGSHFAGIRLHELFSMNFTIHASKFHGQDWANAFKKNWPDDDYFQSSLVEAHFRFAAQNRMFTIFSDWLWSFNHKAMPPDVKQQQYESQLRSLIGRFPNTVIVTYANNEPGGHSRGVDWLPAMREYVEYRARGYGLSDQAWLCDNDEIHCPIDEVVDWAKAAFRGGVMLVETEPYWYWWKFPKGQMERNDYAQYPNYRTRGDATPNLYRFAAALGVSLRPR
ncbi:MAG: hypothetical protein JO038_02540 [Alphaproteobacteria bacterium]|nr:hypothetical protein [Alphaproteobacteria bacterium]